MDHCLHWPRTLRSFLWGSLGLVCIWASQAFAGTLGFQVTFQPQAVQVLNSGDEQVFHLTLYALDRQRQWRPLSSPDGLSQRDLPPGQSMAVLHSSLAEGALGRADPLMLVFKDASGSRFAHLAWRMPPPVPPMLLPFERIGAHVLVRQPQGDMPYRRTWAMGLPSEGISVLARAPELLPPPPPPVEVAWLSAGTTGASLTLDTGTGQRGVWLAHETPTGQLYLQIIGDGLQAGTEQRPVWLQFLKTQGYLLSLGLVILGVLLVWGTQRGLRWPRRELKSAHHHQEAA